MNAHRILIVGDALPAEAMAHMLSGDRHMRVLGIAVTADEALATLADLEADVLLVIGTTDETISRYLPVLARYPCLPVLRSDISATTLQVITSRSIEPRLDQLLAAIALLPKAESCVPEPPVAA
jgi:hypothetical protein